mmetsp:Transcript_36505/g.81488  ORF Transcript_36505/g.81488 Transcript_36505/m.81488 type:complete len:81 (-) Transcript_36505:88-330(-)
MKRRITRLTIVRISYGLALISTSLEQQAHHFQMAPPGSYVKGRTTIISGLVLISTLPEQQAHHFPFAINVIMKAAAVTGS